MLYDAGREDGRRDAAVEIARLSRELEAALEREQRLREALERIGRELENARTRLAHIEREVARLVDAEVISEGKAREVLCVGVDEWREIEDRTLGAGTDT